METGALLDRRSERDRQADRAATLRTGLIASILINTNLRKGAAPVTPEDFLPPAYRTPDVQPTRDQVINYLVSMANAHNASLKRKAN